MPITSAEISFGLVDVTAKQDTTAAASDKQSFIDINDLSLEGVFAPKVATMEKDYWRLDGTYQPFPDNPEDTSWGYWSESMTDEDGFFETSPVLELTFSMNHSSIALTFEFNPHGNDYCTDFNIKWFHDTTLLADKNFTANRWKYSCNEQVENYNKIVITFNKMSKGYRYLKVQNIMHGVSRLFGSDELKEAFLNEEVDLTSGVLSVNTLKFKVYSDDDDFNIFNPKGVYNLLQKKQQMTVEGMIDAERFNLGIFYVDDWRSPGDKNFELEAIDAVGVMDGTTFNGGIYSNKRADDLIEEIMNSAGFGYSLDNSLKNKILNGWLPLGSHREALQQVALAIGAYVDTSRGGAVNIKAQPDSGAAPSVMLPVSRKLMGTAVILRPIVTGVSITEHEYVLQDEVENLFTGELAAGDHEILFNQPVANILATNASILSSNANIAIINVSSPGEVTIDGQKYADNTKVVTIKMAELPAGEKEHILTIEEATLVGRANSAAVADQIFNYYQNRVEQEVSFVLGSQTETVGKVAEIEIFPGTFREAIIESLEINLTGGFRTKGVVAGE